MANQAEYLVLVKYRIVESKMMLLITALNPLMIRKIITDKGRAIKYPNICA